MGRYLGAFLIAALSCIAAQAHAAGITFDTAPPASVIVLENGLQWIWAAPCATHDPSCGAPGNPANTLPIQGFREPTLGEWASSWSSRTELLSRFIVGGSAVCGSPWLSSQYNHCDAGDASGGAIWHAAVNGICDPAFFDGCNTTQAESFLVRTGGPVDLSPVPEPATILLFGSTLASFGVTAWRRARRA
jgi:PEP-CTERM motif